MCKEGINFLISKLVNMKSIVVLFIVVYLFTYCQRLYLNKSAHSFM